uniref:(northern house mosquito) hypothetical protein n=1 Tax=Culex pipiens TaxID=7175 RepID=A0A8D8A7Q8_CULPI
MVSTRNHLLKHVTSVDTLVRSRPLRPPWPCHILSPTNRTTSTHIWPNSDRMGLAWTVWTMLVPHRCTCPRWPRPTFTRRHRWPRSRRRSRSTFRPKDAPVNSSCCTERLDAQ